MTGKIGRWAVGRARARRSCRRQALPTPTRCTGSRLQRHRPGPARIRRVEHRRAGDQPRFRAVVQPDRVAPIRACASNRSGPCRARRSAERHRTVAGARLRERRYSRPESRLPLSCRTPLTTRHIARTFARRWGSFRAPTSGRRLSFPPTAGIRRRGAAFRRARIRLCRALGSHGRSAGLDRRFPFEVNFKGRQAFSFGTHRIMERSEGIEFRQHENLFELRETCGGWMSDSVVARHAAELLSRPTAWRRSSAIFRTAQLA